MSTVDDLPLYQTKSDFDPFVTPLSPRRRSLPGRVGPWPIERSHSEADQWTPPSGSIMDDPFEEEKGKASFKQVLKRIDEECATIQTLVNKGIGATSVYAAEKVSSEEDREKWKTPLPIDLDLERGHVNFLLTVLTLAILGIGVGPLMLIFAFVTTSWEELLLKKDVPSVTVFLLLLAIAFCTITIGLFMSVDFIQHVKYERKVLHHRHRFLADARWADFQHLY